jgi:hypothetical protein
VRYRPRPSAILCLPQCHSQQIPAVLLSYSLRFHAILTLWGFPIDTAHILTEFHKTSPPDNYDDDDSPLFRYCSKYFWGLANQCNDIWQPPKARAGVRNVRSQGKPQIIIAIVKCTHADDRLLPPAEKIEEMRKLFVELGFKGEPGWFIKQ